MSRLRFTLSALAIGLYAAHAGAAQLSQKDREDRAVWLFASGRIAASGCPAVVFQPDIRSMVLTEAGISPEEVERRAEEEAGKFALYLLERPDTDVCQMLFEFYGPNGRSIPGAIRLRDQ